MTDPSSTFATPPVAARALFLDGASRVLLVHPTYKDTWDIPGGYVERGESPPPPAVARSLRSLASIAPLTGSSQNVFGKLIWLGVSSRDFGRL